MKTEQQVTTESKTLTKRQAKEDYALRADAYPRARAFFTKVFGALVRLIYPVRWEGLANMDFAGPCVYVINHQKLFDVVLANERVRRPVNWVAKAELASKPLLGAWIRMMGSIFIKRKQVDVTAIKLMLGQIKRGSNLGIFPEGTRTPWEQRHRAVPPVGIVSLLGKTNVPLVPILIEGPYRFRRRMRIVVGPPFQLRIPPKREQTPERMYALSVEVMRNIYALGPCSYNPPAYSAGAADMPETEVQDA